MKYAIDLKPIKSGRHPCSDRKTQNYVNHASLYFF